MADNLPQGVQDEDILLDTHAIMKLALCSYKQAQDLMGQTGERFKLGDRPVVTLAAWRRLILELGERARGTRPTPRTKGAEHEPLRPQRTRRRSGAPQPFHL